MIQELSSRAFAFNNDRYTLHTKMSVLEFSLHDYDFQVEEPGHFCFVFEEDPILIIPG